MIPSPGAGLGRLAVLLHGAGDGASADEADTLAQVAFLDSLLQRLGWATETVVLGEDPRLAERRLRRLRPDLVVNLVEAVGGCGALSFTAPALLSRLGLPFTGADSRALHDTTDKLRAKSRLGTLGIATPPWLAAAAIRSLDDGPHGPYILKPVTEDASIGIGPDSVVADAQSLRRVLRRRERQYGGSWFAEAYVDGREFNVALLEEPGGVRVLPIAEMRFRNWPAERPRILDYEAKWNVDSAAYRDSMRYFLPPWEQPLLQRRLSALGLRCWTGFGLAGYGRVDMRLDGTGTPWVVDINANPCIAPDSGFIAAAAEAGLAASDVLERLIEAALRRAVAVPAGAVAS